MTTQPSFTQLVRQVVSGADRPLTLAEIEARVEMFRPVNSHSTLRVAIMTNQQIASLGGRPARYTWWPRHLAGNSFRLPLAESDLAAGTLEFNHEVLAALWHGSPRGSGGDQARVTLALTGQVGCHTEIEHVGGGWELDATPVLADWYSRQGATPEDEVIVRVLDVEARRYALELCRRSERNEPAIAARNQALADAAEAVARASKPPTLGFELVPRLVARDVYRDVPPPDPWEDVLRADLRFVPGRYCMYLAERVVNAMERDLDVPPDPGGVPRPRGNRRKVRSDEARQAWGEYLFSRGMDHLWAGWIVEAEAYYREALRIDPGHADAWVHLGNRRFEDGRVAEALGHYERAQRAAEARTIGDPAHYAAPFWLEVDSRPFMRALHGRGLCLWQMGRVDEARQVFAWMMELNPNDNQGVRFLLAGLDEGLTWEEGAARDEEQAKMEEALTRTQMGRRGTQRLH